MQLFEIDKTLEIGLEKGFYKHLAIGIGDRDGVLYERFINTNHETLFDMASLTKVVVTTMVAYQMIERGKLCLTDSIADYLDVPADKKGITIQHLMTHTAGFEPFFNIEEAAKTKDQVVQVIMRRPLFRGIGEQVHYSCIGYIVLGKILEKIGQMTLEALAKKYVFEPLGLSSSTYHPVGENIAPTEKYSLENKHLQGIVHDENARFVGNSGNAGLFSNLQDMMVFAHMLACGGKYKDKAYMSPAMFRRGIVNYTEGLGESRGLGFSLYTYNLHASGDLFSYGSFGHTGFTGTSMFVDKETGLYVVLLTNRVYHGREDTGYLAMRRQLHNQIVSQYTKRYL